MLVAKASEPLTIDSRTRTQFAELSQSAKAQLDLAETLVGSRSLAE
jgi:hypothetical protein